MDIMGEGGDDLIRAVKSGALKSPWVAYTPLFEALPNRLSIFSYHYRAVVQVVKIGRLSRYLGNVRKTF